MISKRVTGYGHIIRLVLSRFLTEYESFGFTLNEFVNVGDGFFASAIEGSGDGSFSSPTGGESQLGIHYQTRASDQQ